MYKFLYDLPYIFYFKYTLNFEVHSAHCWCTTSSITLYFINIFIQLQSQFIILAGVFLRNCNKNHYFFICVTMLDIMLTCDSKFSES